jgi:hypothetical protein
MRLRCITTWLRGLFPKNMYLAFTKSIQINTILQTSIQITADFVIWIHTEEPVTAESRVIGIALAW